MTSSEPSSWYQDSNSFIYFWIYWRHWGVRETMNILIWASCEVSRASLCSRSQTKIKPGKMPEEILNRFDINYIVLPTWKCTLLESLTIIMLNYKHCMPACSTPANAAIVCMQCLSSVKTLPPLDGLEATSSLLSFDPNFSSLSLK